MKAVLFFLVLLTAQVLCSQEKDAVLRKYDMVTGYEIKEMKVKDIDFLYTLNFRDDTVKVWTVDPKFTTPEQYKIGTKFNELPKHYQKRAVKQPGYGYVVSLPDCWDLYFCEGANCTEENLKSDSEVKWIQKGK